MRLFVHGGLPLRHTVLLALCSCATSRCGVDPPVWPRTFRLLQRKYPDSGSGNASVTTYYDVTKGANLLIITPDENKSDVLWDLELDTKSSYYFTPSRHTCTRMSFPVGILRPDWLHGAQYLGVRPCPFQPDQQCAGWTKDRFIDYYAYLDTCAPASWYFWSMAAFFVTVSYEPGTRAPAGYFRPPSYCNVSLSSDVGVGAGFGRAIS